MDQERREYLLSNTCHPHAHVRAQGCACARHGQRRRTLQEQVHACTAPCAHAPSPAHACPHSRQSNATCGPNASDKNQCSISTPTRLQYCPTQHQNPNKAPVRNTWLLTLLEHVVRVLCWHICALWLSWQKTQCVFVCENACVPMRGSMQELAFIYMR